jgi:hypothetical protein
MRIVDLSSDGSVSSFGSTRPSWVLVYATVDHPYRERIAELARRLPDTEIFGATSFQGVLSPSGFNRGIFALVADRTDRVQAAAEMRATNGARARAEAKTAATRIKEKLGRVDTLLLHATPGFEERLLEGIAEAFEGAPPALYGGSAADDDLSGKWAVLGRNGPENEGFTLVGFASEKPMHGSFVAGYTPSSKHGVITSASGRRILTIEDRPAAVVYNEWVGGKLADLLETGGNALSRTTLDPLGRLIDKVGAVPRYLLSHPHEIHRDGSLSLFTEVSRGEEVVLMVGSPGALVDRTDQVAARATRGAGLLSGSVLVYCAGCVGAIGDRVPLVAKRFSDRIGRAPFIGAATFGEQGCFTGDKAVNRHGNLMCDAIMFE